MLLGGCFAEDDGGDFGSAERVVVPDVFGKGDVAVAVLAAGLACGLDLQIVIKTLDLVLFLLDFLPLPAFLLDLHLDVRILLLDDLQPLLKVLPARLAPLLQLPADLVLVF